MEDGRVFHVVMFPWLAVGHLRPFFQLSKCLARKGHRVSYVSTPRNLQRLPRVPSDITSLINLVSIPLPKIEELRDDVESSMDVPHAKQQLIKAAFDLLQSPVATFLKTAMPEPDCIIYDYASHWLPQLAAENGTLTVYFSLFTAAFMAYLGPPSLLLSGEDGRSTVKDFTVVPRWIPFHSNIAYRHHEVINVMESVIRFATTISRSKAVIFRTCTEFEPEWFNLVCQLYEKPVIPIGLLPPILKDEDEDGENKYGLIRDWLDKRTVNSLLYVALGTEAILSKEQVYQLALGLDKCGLPFFWVLRNPLTSTKDAMEMLPDGFLDRVKERGIVYTQWAPQVKILSHRAVGGFLTHCGWNSVIEGLSFGRVLILFPVMNDQGINSRQLQEKNVGLEIPRNETDGSFTSDAVAETVRLVMVGEEGKTLRDNAKRMGDIFTDEGKNRSYADSLVSYLMETSGCKGSS